MQDALRRSFLVLFACVIAYGFACGDPSLPYLGDPVELTAEGWVAFEQGNFEFAIAKFDSAIQADSAFAEAYNGSAWGQSMLANYEMAGGLFDEAIALDPNAIQAQAGATLVFHAINRFNDAIPAASYVLDSDPEFVFIHQPSIDAMDIRITLALSYFSVSRFADAATQMDIIDPSHSPHSFIPQELIVEIMRFFGQIR